MPPRGGFTFNGQFTGNPVADFLLGYCSTCTGAFGSSRSNYSSPTFAPFIDDNWQVSSRLTLQMGLRWRVLGPWHEKNNQEGSFDPVSGKIAFHVVPTNLPASLVPLIINQDDFFPSGILKKDLNNFGPRVGVVYSANDTTVVRTRLRRLLRQSQPERAAVLAARAAVLRTVFAAAGQDRPRASTPTRCFRT